MVSFWQPDGKTFDAPCELDYLYDYNKDLEADSKHILQIAAGWESGGNELFLSTRTGEMVTPLTGYGNNADDVREYVDRTKRHFETLQMIPYSEGFNNLAAGLVDIHEHITEEEILNAEGDWETDLAKRYLRQVYREHGWPKEFRREEAFSVVDGLLEKLKEREETVAGRVFTETESVWKREGIASMQAEDQISLRLLAYYNKKFYCPKSQCYT